MKILGIQELRDSFLPYYHKYFVTILLLVISITFVPCSSGAAATASAAVNTATVSNNKHLSQTDYGGGSSYHSIQHPAGYSYPTHPAYYGYGNMPSSKSIRQKQDAFGAPSMVSDDSGQTSGDGTSGILGLLSGAGSGLGGAALGGITGLLGLTGYGLFTVAGVLLFLFIIGPVIAAGIAVPIVAIVYASIYIPSIGILNQDPGELVAVMPGMLGGMKGRALLGRSVHDAEQCVERISCEIARASRGNVFGNFVKWAAEKSETKSANTVVKRAASAVKRSSNCKQYSCDPIGTVRRFMR